VALPAPNGYNGFGDGRRQRRSDVAMVVYRGASRHGSGRAVKHMPHAVVPEWDLACLAHVMSIDPYAALWNRFADIIWVPGRRWPAGLA